MTNNDSISKAFTLDMTNQRIADLTVMLTAVSALAIEIRTGMTTSRGRGPMDVARKFGFEGRLKSKAIIFLEEKIKELDPTHKPLPSVQKVLDGLRK